MHYRKIDPRFWNDGKVRALSDDGKLSLLFVMTHLHLTAVGAMRATLEGLAAELGWPARRFRRALQPAIASGIVDYDARASFIGLPNFLRYNEPEGPNSVKAWRAALERLPECEAKARLIARCRAWLTCQSAKFRAAVGDAKWLGIGDAMRDGIQDGLPVPIPDPGAGTGAETGAGTYPPTPLSMSSSSNGRSPEPLTAAREDPEALDGSQAAAQARKRVAELVAQATRAAPGAPTARTIAEARRQAGARHSAAALAGP